MSLVGQNIITLHIAINKATTPVFQFLFNKSIVPIPTCPSINKNRNINLNILSPRKQNRCHHQNPLSLQNKKKIHYCTSPHLHLFLRSIRNFHIGHKAFSSTFLNKGSLSLVLSSTSISICPIIASI